MMIPTVKILYLSPFEGCLTDGGTREGHAVVAHCELYARVYDQFYGPGKWLVADPGTLPSELDGYTLENGELTRM